MPAPLLRPRQKQWCPRASQANGALGPGRAGRPAGQSHDARGGKTFPQGRQRLGRMDECQERGRVHGGCYSDRQKSGRPDGRPITAVFNGVAACVTNTGFESGDIAALGPTAAVSFSLFSTLPSRALDQTHDVDQRDASRTGRCLPSAPIRSIQMGGVIGIYVFLSQMPHFFPDYPCSTYLAISFSRG